MDQSLDDVLNGEEVVEEVVEEVTTEEPTETETTEEETEPAAEEPSSTAERKTEEKDWTFTAYQDEKRKRQELERKLEELQKPKEKAPDVFDDPEGYQTYQQTQIDSKITNVKAEMSQFMAQREFGKERVESAFAKFSEMVKEQPELYTKAIKAVSPYHEIVEIVEKAEKFEKMQNVDEFEAQMRAKIEQQIRAEFEQKYASQSAKKSVTPSLNSQKSAAGYSQEPSSQSLTELLGR